MEPLTGRYHQLRRHFRRMMHPIAGDTTHGCRHLNHDLQTRLGWWRLQLFAEELAFPHPRTGTPLHFVDDPARGVGPWWEQLQGIAAGA
jgi:tRNA pseudouridine65 synthase